MMRNVSRNCRRFPVNPPLPSLRPHYRVSCASKLRRPSNDYNLSTYLDRNLFRSEICVGWPIAMSWTLQLRSYKKRGPNKKEKHPRSIRLTDGITQKRSSSPDCSSCCSRSHNLYSLPKYTPPTPTCSLRDRPSIYISPSDRVWNSVCVYVYKESR